MNASNGSQRSKSWSAYWSSGRLHSCAEGVADNYQGAIGAFWEVIAARISRGARMLDLATGNGPLPLLFWGLKEGEIDIDAVDMADVAPAWCLPDVHRRVRFHSGVAMESLPFDRGSFDVVVSQYGLEYADRNAAISECARVAAPDALIALVLHHADSVLVSVGRAELIHYARLLGQTGIFATARAIVPVLACVRGGMRTDAVEADQARLGYNRAMEELSAAIAASPVPDVLLEARSMVHALVANIRPDGVERSIEALSIYEDHFIGAQLRTSEMVASALDRRQLDAMIGQFGEVRPDSLIEFGELRQVEGVVGWWLTVSSPSQR